VRSFRDFKVWRKAHLLTLRVYSASGSFPREELYGLTSQMRRAAASIPENIAEGCGRRSSRDFVRFLHVAAGSASELEYELLLARDLSLLDECSYSTLANEVTQVKRMLHSLSEKLLLTADG
jgi:four helix bundle protein